MKGFPRVERVLPPGASRRCSDCEPCVPSQGLRPASPATTLRSQAKARLGERHADVIPAKAGIAPAGSRGIPAFAGMTARIAAALVFASLASLVLLAVSCQKPEEEQTVVPFNQDLARQPGKTLPGKTYDNREKIRQAMPENELLAALGKPTEKLESKGLQLSGRFTYLYADGRIVVTLRDGIVVDVETTFY